MRGLGQKLPWRTRQIGQKQHNRFPNRHESSQSSSIIINHQDIHPKSSNSHQMIFHLPSGVIKHGVLENTPSELVP
jgi:hypothetical protein